MTHLSSLVETAADLRRRAGLLVPPFSTTKIIESCFPDTTVAGARLPSGVHEMTSTRRDRTVIVYQRSLSGPEQRYAIAHALGHLAFGDIGFEGACVRAGRMGNASLEIRADMFADHLLVPLDVLGPLVRHWPAEGDEHEIYLDQCDALASDFAVPVSVIELQIRRLQMTCTFVRHV